MEAHKKKRLEEDGWAVGDAEEFLGIDKLNQLQGAEAHKKHYVVYYGGMRGKIHSIFKKAFNPYIKIRDVLTDKLIVCYYPKKSYGEIVRLLEERDSTVAVFGRIIADRTDHSIIQIWAEKFEVLPKYQEGDREKFIGCAPDLTGGLSSEEYIRRNRGGE